MKQEFGITSVLLLLVGLFSLLSQDFFSWSTWGGILSTSTEIGLMALGTTLLMTCGEFDLSIGSLFALTGMLFAMGTQGPEAAASPLISWGTFAGVLILGALIGWFHGLVTVKTKIPSFITTLGGLLFWRGIVLLMTEGFPLTAMEVSSVMAAFGTDLGHGVRSSVLVWPLVGVILAYILHHHPFGNWVMATGGQEQASFSMGIPTTRVKLVCFSVNGFLAALAGVIQYSHLGGMSPTAGEQYELRSIAIAVIGGTALTGGRGTILGTLLGTLLLSLLNAGLVQAGVSTYWFRSLVGLILVLAVVTNMRLMKWQETRLSVLPEGGP